jgi:uncharacterized protein
MSFAWAKQYRGFHTESWVQFFEHVEPLLRLEQVQLLDDCRQHYKYTRLRHSIDVAYLSFRLAKRLGWDSKSTARAALLHDLFFHEENEHSASLLLSHPKIALKNARNLVPLNKIEEDIILRHMFLLTPHPPRYKESYIVTFVDKFCAAREFAVSLFSHKEMHAVKPITGK